MCGLVAAMASLFLVGCLALPQQDSSKSQWMSIGIDPELAPAVTRFYAEAGKRGLVLDPSKVGVRFASLNPGQAGVCRSSAIESSVYIDYEIYGKLTDAQRDDLIMHELGHCALGRKHDEGTVFSCESMLSQAEKTGVFHLPIYPSSIMNPVLSSDALELEFYVENQKAYYDELYLGKPLTDRSELGAEEVSGTSQAELSRMMENCWKQSDLYRGQAFKNGARVVPVPTKATSTEVYHMD